ncbi:hypothetical protein BC829DRAFT_487547 [Chytridium lagenaria]|nr:hypothetical protein BC829DRAFT_487547 [Chytridium lagenaria]
MHGLPTLSTISCKDRLGLTNEARRVWVHTVMKRSKTFWRSNPLETYSWPLPSSLQVPSLSSLGLWPFLETIGSRRDTTNPRTLWRPTFHLLKILVWNEDGSCHLDLLFCILLLCNRQYGFYNHVGLVINTALTEDLISVADDKFKGAYEMMGPSHVADLLNRGSRFQTIGLRSCFSSFPLIVYLWGPYYLLGGSFLLVLALRALDLNVTSLVKPLPKTVETVSMSRIEAGPQRHAD